MNPSKPSGQAELRRLFQQASTEDGQEYEVAEGLFCGHGDDALKFLDALEPRSHDPLEPVLIEALRKWLQGEDKVFDLALALPDNLEELQRGSPNPEPNPVEIASRLARYYQGRPALYLAVRLAKQKSWPVWKVEGLLLYLKRQLDPQTLPAILRFALGCRHKGLRSLALDAVKAFPAELTQAATEAESRYRLERSEEGDS